jgi:uncharacterized protein YndB with AHSA1/START domain
MQTGIIVIVLLAVGIGALIGYAASRPDSFRIERSTRIEAPPERVFMLLQDLRAWQSWSPWEGKDPALERTYSGAELGPGAVYEWSGNRAVGRGRMEVVEAHPPARLLIKLDFFAPFEAHNFAEFTLTPLGAATEITWSMYGPSPFMAKLMGLVFSMDKMVGKDFETGLANLKRRAESA